MDLVFNKRIAFSIAKRRGIWYGREYHNGKRVSEKSLGTKLKKEADSWLQQMNAVKYSPDLQKRLSGGKRYFGDEIEKFRKRTVDLVSKTSQKSGIAYDSRIRWCFDMVPKDKALDDITKDDLQDWYSELLHQLAPTTIKGILRLAKAFFKENEIEPNPIDFLKCPKITRTERPFWTLEEISKILEAAPDDANHRFWVIMAFGGLRAQEAVDLDWNDLDLNKRTLTIRNGKGNKSRIIPLHQVILEELAQTDVLERRGEIIKGLKTHPYARLLVLQRTVKNWKFQAPGPATLHRFRHSFASNLIRNGANIKSVQLLMGHANINITLDTYGHLLPGDLEKAVSLLNS